MDGRRGPRAARLVTALGLAVALGAATVVITQADRAGHHHATAGGAMALTASASSAAAPICTSASHPALAARMSKNIAAAMQGRSSVVGLAVDDRVTGVTCKFHPHWHFDSASVVKVTILSALLRKLQQEHRSLTAKQKQLATQMITVSDNNAASTLWAETGRPALQHFLNLAGMSETELGPSGYWGLTLITAHDELTLLKVLTSTNTVLTTASRNYVLGLMARVVSYERWGVPAGAPTDVTVHVKNGWLPLATHGWRINSIGSFSGHGRNYMIVVLTMDNPTMAYGVDTVQGIAEVINRALNPAAASVVPAATPNKSWGQPDEKIPAQPGRS
jgi:beta-lactamase family protein